MANSEKSIVLVGLMGSGKSRVGIALAKLLNRPFLDSDIEIEKAAGLSIADIFARFGEQEFRRGEKEVILRLLSRKDIVIASGGGAFMQVDVRKAIKTQAISIWLKADVETLVERTSRTTHRPLLQGVDKKQKLQELMEARYPVYAEADITIVTDGSTPAATAEKIRQALVRFEKESKDA